MQDMHLPYTNALSLKTWSEVIPPGSVSDAPMSFSSNSAVRVLNIRVPWGNVANAIQHIIGSSDTFNNAAAGDATPGPFSLTRINPARHPQWPNLRATRILNVRGEAPSKVRNVTGLNGGAVWSGEGVYGNWQFGVITVQFEVPRYPIIDDSEMRTMSLPGTPSTGRRPEYLRHHIFEFDTNLETLARKGETWTLVNATAYAQQPSFSMDRLLRQAKGVLKITGYDIHEDYVKLGRLLPTNYYNRIGTVNSLPFPLFGMRDQNKTGDFLVRFRPGTCLLLPPKITPYAQCHPRVFSHVIEPTLFPRMVEVETQMIVFDPPTIDTTTIDLSAATYSEPIPAGGGAYYQGSATQRIYGHNLVPLERPIPATGGRWYAAINNAGGRITRITSANPAVVTSPAHNIPIGTVFNIIISGVEGPATGFGLLNGTWRATVLTSDTFSLATVAGAAYNTSALTPPYSRGGQWTSRGTVVFNDKNLLYQYSNFEQLWRAPESMPDDFYVT